MRTRYLILLLLTSACSPDFLEIKQDVSIGTPYTIQDFQAVLDHNIRMNSNASVILGMVGSDEFKVSSESWNGLPTASFVNKNAYVWADDVYERGTVDDWNDAYERILYTNMALEGIGKIVFSPQEQPDWENVKGSALFFRGLNFYQVAQLFAGVYRSATAHKEPGIPIRLESDVTASTVRSTLRQTYDRILLDLNDALPLLPDKSVNTMRPSKLSAFCLLARVHLQMEMYEEAYSFALKALEIEDGLTDYTTLSSAGTYFFPRDNGASHREIVLFNYAKAATILTSSRLQVVDDLIALYRPGDKRKDIFYTKNAQGVYFYRGSFTGYSTFFVGQSIPELYLMAAECAVRLGEVKEGITWLNNLRAMRFDPQVDYEIDTNLGQSVALDHVLDERRIELAFKGLRWEDLRRLNKDPRYAKEIKREINGREYILQPDSKRYVWPIPDLVIEISGIEQNDR